MPPSLPGVPSAGPGIPVPSPDLPGIPVPIADLPRTPDVDPGGVVWSVGPLPVAPSVSAPDAALPELPELAQSPLTDGLLPPVPPDPAPAAPEPIGAGVFPDSPLPTTGAAVPAAAVVPPAPEQSGFAPLDAGAVFAVFASGSAPARAPPTGAPLRPCGGSGTPHSSRGDPVGSPPSGADLAIRRAGLLADSRSYASTLILDPVLRPD
jgi:hypothetical protein